MARAAAAFVLMVIGGLGATLSLQHVAPYYFTEALLGQVGVNVGVLPNQYNSLNEALDQKAAYLDEREAYLNQKEAELATTSRAVALAAPESNALVWLFMVLFAALACLVFINFFLDWKRSRELRSRMTLSV